MAKQSRPSRKEIPALRVPQWLDEWNSVSWDPSLHRREPEHCCYQFNLSAPELKALCGIYPRSASGRTRGAEDLGIQRRHEESRSTEIGEFVRFGYPWSDLGKAKRDSGQFDDLRKPGWLPTAIVVNILRPEDKRLGKSVVPEDLVTIVSNGEGSASIQLPISFTENNWQAKSIPPLEVIDGQHRLWAFQNRQLQGDFCLPVVAFFGLDLSWQAYLFYTINIKPKKINPSLAFDLYPLLRTEDWLEKFDGHVIYRETRAQELVDLLYSHPDSPWHERINMLGESGVRGRMVSQAAWIRSLLVTFVKTYEGPRIAIGGLFGAPVGSHRTTLAWSRADQAAFLIVAGQCLQKHVSSSKERWAKALRADKTLPLFGDEDLAFSGSRTLINQDQGIRAFLHVINDLCFVNADKLNLSAWGIENSANSDLEKAVSTAVAELQKNSIGKFLDSICRTLATYDWRTSDASELEEPLRLMKAAFRGSGGYKELRKQLLGHLAKNKDEVGRTAAEVMKILRYS